MLSVFLTRRGLLGAAAASGVGAGVSGCGGVEPWSVVRGTLESPYAVNGAADWFLARPPGNEVVPVILLLHGTGQRADQILQSRQVVETAQQAAPGVAVAGIDGASSYWHERADGSDTGALVLEQLLPLLADQRVDVGRPAWLGWSMGGFGALLLASRWEQQGERSGPVLMSSPALWSSWSAAEEMIPEAFDSAGDWQTQMALVGAGVSAPVRADIGRHDPFQPAVTEWVATHDVELRTAPGGHTAAFSDRQLPSQLSWLDQRVDRS